MNNPILGDERVHEVWDRIAPIITELVEKAIKQGAVRPDLDQTDLIFIQLALSPISDSARELAPDLYRRYLTIFLDGIRTDRGAFTALPIPALTAQQTHTAIRAAPQRRRVPRPRQLTDGTARNTVSEIDPHGHRRECVA
jgi:hypothetical protein